MKITIARLFVLITLVSLQANASSLVDGDAAEGKNKAVTCSACHGAEGNSANPAWPNIAGQNANYTSWRSSKPFSRERMTNRLCAATR